MSFRIECAGKQTREINRLLHDAIAKGEGELELLAPDARHNLAVAILKPVQITFDGSVGYYCAGMSDGVNVTIRGSAGWGTAESVLSAATATVDIFEIVFTVFSSTEFNCRLGSSAERRTTKNPKQEKTGWKKLAEAELPVGHRSLVQVERRRLRGGCPC